MILPTIIGETQGAFISERQILDGIFVANELIHSKNRRKEEGVLLKIDIEKVYDHVEWTYIDLLQKMGFGIKWRWNRACL